jgi:hypothetical protein
MFLVSRFSDARKSSSFMRTPSVPTHYAFLNPKIVLDDTIHRPLHPYLVVTYAKKKSSFQF